jgi:hypothetical protein
LAIGRTTQGFLQDIRAREAQADSLVDDILSIADDAERVNDNETSGVTI